MKKLQSCSLTCQTKLQTKEEAVKRIALLKARLLLPLRKGANMFLNLQTIPRIATLKKEFLVIYFGHTILRGRLPFHFILPTVIHSFWMFPVSMEN